MTIRDTAEVANKVRADLVKEKYRAEHFKDEDPKDIKRRLVDHIQKPNTTYNYVVSAMSDQEVREEFARRLNNDTTDFSTYTLNLLNKHLNNLKKEQLWK